MADYRDTIGKKKQRQTGINVGPISIGGGGGGGSSDDQEEEESEDDDSGGGGFIGGAIDSAQDAVDDASDAVDDATDTVEDTVDDVSSGVDDTIDDTTDGVSDTIDDAVGGIGGVVDDAQDTIDDASDTVDDSVGDAGNAIGNIGDTVDDTVDDAADTADDAFDGIGDTVDDAIDDSQDTFDDVISGAGDAFEDAQETVDDAVEGAGDAFDDAQDTIGDVTDDAIDAPDIGNLVPDIEAPSPGDVLDEASGEVSDAFDDATDFGGDVAEGAGDVFDNATDIADDAFGSVGDTFDDVTEGAEDAFDDATDAAGETFDDAIDFTGTVGDDIFDTADDALEGAGDFAGDVAGGASNVAGSVFGGAVDAAQGAAGLGLDVVDAAADTVLFTPFNIGQEFGEAAANQLSNIGGGGIVGNQGDTSTVPDNESGASGTPVQWSEPSQATTVTGAVILRQEALNTPDARVRFFAIGEDKSGDKVAFGANNKAVKINSVDNLGNLPHFDTLQAAKEVVPHRGGRRNERSESQKAWDSPTQVDQVGAVAILKQVGQDSEGLRDIRFFAATQTDQQQKVFLKSATELVRVANINTLDDAPSFESRSEAKTVAENYMETLQDGSGNERSTEDSPRNQGDGSSEESAPRPWGNSNSVDTVGNVAIIEQTRQTQSGDTQTRYLAVAQVEGEGVAVVESGNKAVRVKDPSRDDIPSFDSEQAAASAADSFLNTDEEQQTVTDKTETTPSGPTGGTGSTGSLLSGLSPTTLGVGALAIGGGLLAAFSGGDSQTTARDTNNNGSNGDMSNMRVRASSNTGSNSR